MLITAGDVLSANIAMEAALREGFKVKMVLTHRRYCRWAQSRGAPQD